MGLHENNNNIEMLFIDDKYRGKGIGKKLINYTVNKYAADKVTINKQNQQAIGFYEKMGFAVFKETPVDEQGRPYPLLYIALQKKDLGADMYPLLQFYPVTKGTITT